MDRGSVAGGGGGGRSRTHPAGNRSEPSQGWGRAHHNPRRFGGLL
ncbi:hypothetical protein ACFDR9_005562, partial [Janthinobacterium sp. CG_23.3]